jgi:type IV pilus assembly protein PilA
MQHDYPQPHVYPRQPESKAPIVVAVVACAVLMLCLVGIVAAIVVPNLLAPRRAANEGMAIEHMRTLASAQETYFSQQAKIGGRGKYGTLEELDAMNLLPGGLASGTVGGYRYRVRLFEEKYEATATPVSSSEGTRSFYLDASGVIYGADRKGLDASASDPPITMVIKPPKTPPPLRPMKLPPIPAPSPLGRY